MDITYNGVSQSLGTNMITFTEVPNILKVSEYITGSYANLLITFSWGLQNYVERDNQYYFTLLGETITNVTDPQKAVNKNFYISSSVESTAASFAAALRNCASIAVDFNVVHQADEVYIYAKTVGRKFSNMTNYIDYNIPRGFFNVDGEDGNVYSDFYNSKILVDIYSSPLNNVDFYVTTLEKNFYGNECSFDMSPVLATISEYGKNQPYRFDISRITENGTYDHLNSISGSSVVGYIANQSDKYLYNEGVKILLNTKRGDDGITFYTYSNVLDFTTLCGADTGGWTRNVKVMNSADEVIYETNSTKRKTSSNNIIDDRIVIPISNFSNAYYIEITEGTNETVRFNVIKPLKASGEFQRIYWRNEYGGIQFFDFTASRSESDSVDISTYEKNVFDYYTTDEFERKKIYKNDYNKEVKLTSHIMDASGKWVFNSLMRSKKLWTEINGKVYYIIPKSIEVVEDNNYKGAYTAKLTYTYSDL